MSDDEDFTAIPLSATDRAILALAVLLGFSVVGLACYVAFCIFAGWPL